MMVIEYFNSKKEHWHTKQRNNDFAFRQLYRLV